MRYPGRSRSHDRKFDRDCEQVFGSLERADDRLATFLFELGHGGTAGTEIVPWVTAFVLSDERPFVVIVEFESDRVLLRGLVALEISLPLAA